MQIAFNMILVKNKSEKRSIQLVSQGHVFIFKLDLLQPFENELNPGL